MIKCTHAPFKHTLAGLCCILMALPSSATVKSDNVTIRILDVQGSVPALVDIVFDVNGNTCTYTAKKQDLMDKRDEVIDKAFYGCKGFLQSFGR